MAYTEKQIKFIEYLVKRLGFRDGPQLDQYIEGLFAKYPNDYWDMPDSYSAIDFLLDEQKLKNEKKYEIIRDIPPYITASDLAGYTFCPVGFSIGKSFKIEQTQEAEIGTLLHEQAKLSNLYQLKARPGEFGGDSLVNDDNRELFNDIKSSSIIYSGHSSEADSKKYFRNDKINFIGQPDYVFKNINDEFFIVEEKFQKEKDRDSNVFFQNHKVQLASYIYFLEMFNASYGYLVYWIYNTKQHTVKINRCLVFKITRNEKTQKFLESRYNDVKEFLLKKFLNINPENLNPNKCVNCVYTKYCGHKNGRKNQVSLPYQRAYHNLYPVEKNF